MRDPYLIRGLTRQTRPTRRSPGQQKAPAGKGPRTGPSRAMDQQAFVIAAGVPFRAVGAMDADDAEVCQSRGSRVDDLSVNQLFTL